MWGVLENHKTPASICPFWLPPFPLDLLFAVENGPAFSTAVVKCLVVSPCPDHSVCFFSTVTSRLRQRLGLSVGLRVQNGMFWCEWLSRPWRVGPPAFWPLKVFHQASLSFLSLQRVKKDVDKGTLHTDMFLLKTEGSGKEEGKPLLQLGGCAGSSAAGLWSSLFLWIRNQKKSKLRTKFPF